MLPFVTKYEPAVLNIKQTLINEKMVHYTGTTTTQKNLQRSTHHIFEGYFKPSRVSSRKILVRALSSRKPPQTIYQQKRYQM